MKKVALLMCLAIWLVPATAVAQEEEAFALIDKGQRQVQRGRLPAAYATFKEALAMDPRNGTAMNALAQVASFLEFHDESVFYYMAYLYVEADYLGDAEEVKKALEKQERSISGGGKLTITSDPEDLEITVNGVPLSQGSFVLPVAPGKPYKIAAEKEDFHPYEKTFVVQSGEEKLVGIRLKKIIYKGKVKIKILPSPSSVDVYNDTKALGKGVASVETTEGKHLLCFKKEGFDRWWRYVNVPRNDTVELDVVLREQSRPDEPCNVWPSIDD